MSWRPTWRARVSSHLAYVISERQEVSFDERLGVLIRKPRQRLYLELHDVSGMIARTVVTGALAALVNLRDKLNLR